jgi:uncharacterized cupin superfamily protein
MSSNTPTPVLNIDDVPVMDFGNGSGFQAKLGRIGPIVGAEQLGCMLTVVPPGKKAFPFHNHHANEEMAFILSGTGEVRLGEGRYPLRAGDVVAMPAGGPEAAHQIINTGTEELRYLCLSTMRMPEAVEYPDSGKFAVTAQIPPGGGPRDAGLRFIGRAETTLDYWDGEG